MASPKPKVCQQSGRNKSQMLRSMTSMVPACNNQTLFQAIVIYVQATLFHLCLSWAAFGHTGFTHSLLTGCRQHTAQSLVTRFLFLYHGNGSSRSSQKWVWLSLRCDQHGFFRIQFPACITQELYQFVHQRHDFMGRPRECQGIVCKSNISDVLKKTYFRSNHASLSHACVDLKSAAEIWKLIC